MIDLKSGKVQASIGIPTLLAAALAFADTRFVDHAEMDNTMVAAMNQVSRDRREDQLYLINRDITRLKVTQKSRALSPVELQRLYDLETDARRLQRLLGSQ